VAETLLICAVSLTAVVIVNRYLTCAIHRAALRRRKKTILMAVVVAAALWMVSMGLCLGSLAGAWAFIYARPGFQQFPVLVQVSMLVALGTAAIWAAGAGTGAAIGGTNSALAAPTAEAEHRPLSTKVVVGYMSALGVLIPVSFLAITNADAIAEWGRLNLTTLLGSDVTAMTVTLAVVLPPTVLLGLGASGLVRLWSLVSITIRTRFMMMLRRHRT
jgi:hypothetical protein